MRHEAEMAAPSREEVFAALRAQGIRPIKVVEKGAAQRAGVRKRVVFAVALATAVIVGLLSWFLSAHTHGNGSSVVASTNGVVVVRQAVGLKVVAQPLARQRIPGNRMRIDNVPASLFDHKSEAFLSKFAEPGRRVDDFVLTAEMESDFEAALKDSVMVAADELSEYIDLKRIVAGMKREMRAYIAGGGTVRDYVTELVKRQKMELAYREKAENHLNELLTPKGDDVQSSVRSEVLSGAYAYWLKANASLQSMGIAPLALPDALRAYQMSLDIDDAEGIPTIEAKVIESPPVAIPPVANP